MHLLRGVACLLASAVAGLSVTASASAATTPYMGTINGDIETLFSFDLVKKDGKRTVKNIAFESIPLFCDDGQSTVGNGGGSSLKARVGDDDRFVGTGFNEGGTGSISLSHIRGEFRQNRTVAGGRFSHTIRFIGGKECSSGFVDWTADRVNRR